MNALGQYEAWSCVYRLHYMEQNAVHLPLIKGNEVEPKGQLTTKFVVVVNAYGRM